jgi:hypothetical protein
LFSKIKGIGIERVHSLRGKVAKEAIMVGNHFE